MPLLLLATVEVLGAVWAETDKQRREVGEEDETEKETQEMQTLTPAVPAAKDPASVMEAQVQRDALRAIIQVMAH